LHIRKWVLTEKVEGGNKANWGFQEARVAEAGLEKEERRNTFGCLLDRPEKKTTTTIRGRNIRIRASTKLIRQQ